MLLHLASSLLCRLAVMALTGATGFFALLPNQSLAQSVAWSGVNEGGIIQLLPGMASTNLAITASPTMSTGPTNLVFALEWQGNVVLNQTSAPSSVLTLTNLSPGKYFLAAMLQSPTLPVLGDISFDIHLATVRPTNDDWRQAAILSDLDTVVTGSNLYATREANEAAPGGGGAGKSIWWEWRASSSGVFTATTAGSSFDTLLSVYAGTNLDTLALAGANDDVGPNSFSQVTFSATNGVTYYFLVDSAIGSTGGQAQLALVAGSPPSIAVTAPVDGALILVGSAAQATNIGATIAAMDTAGIVSVKYWFDGGTNVSRSGLMESPYELDLTNLFTGHYLLTVEASNNKGLVSVANAGLSVMSLEPVLVIERSASIPGKFQVGLTGLKGPEYSLQTSSNLDVWCGVNTWTNFSGAVKVADTNLARPGRGFFRAVSAR